jgi:hypothetical protein
MSEMPGIEKPLAGTGIRSFDLTPSGRHPLIPSYAPLRNVRYRLPLPRYAPGPLADDMARVILDDDYYLGPQWGDYYPQTSCSPDAVFDVPSEQRDRWQAAMDAYRAMQEEIEGLMEARRRSPEPVKRGPYIPQP